MLLDLDLAKQNTPRVGLQSDEVRCYCLSSIRVVVHEVGLLRPIEKHCETVALYANLKLVPLTRTARPDALIEILIGYIVNGAGRAELLVHILSQRWVAASESVNLHFKAEVHGQEGRVVIVLRIQNQIGEP